MQAVVGPKGCFVNQGGAKPKDGDWSERIGRESRSIYLRVGWLDAPSQSTLAGRARHAKPFKADDEAVAGLIRALAGKGVPAVDWVAGDHRSCPELHVVHEDS